MPKTHCLQPLCIRHRFNVANAVVRFTFNGTPPGIPAANLPNYDDYVRQWQRLRPQFLRPMDLDCEPGCRCVKFGNAPTIPNQPAPITLAEWDSPDGSKSRWEVAGVTMDTWIGHCAPAGSRIRIGEGPWRQVDDVAPGPGFSSVLPGGGGHKKSGGKKKAKRKAAKAPRRRR